MEDINLHFTGDMHAITTAHNLAAAVLDNHLFHGNDLNIDPENVAWPRVVDLNDRALRSIDRRPRAAKAFRAKTRFDITVASEVMAILCLARPRGPEGPPGTHHRRPTTRTATRSPPTT